MAKRKRDMAEWGLTDEDFEDQPQANQFELYVWEENRLAFEVFCFMDTQWHIGMSGQTGMIYEVLYQKLDRMNLKPEAYEQLFEDVRTMELAHLKTVGEYRDEQDAKNKSKKPR